MSRAAQGGRRVLGGRRQRGRGSDGRWASGRGWAIGVYGLKDAHGGHGLERQARHRGARHRRQMWREARGRRRRARRRRSPPPGAWPERRGRMRRGLAARWRTEKGADASGARGLERTPYIAAWGRDLCDTGKDENGRKQSKNS